MVLSALFSLLCLIRYDYTVLDSTKFTDWHKGLHEAFLCIRVGLGESMFPVHGDVTTSELEFVEGIPEGPAIVDGAFDAKPALNNLAFKEYIPIVNPGKSSPGGYGAREVFDEALYKLRGVGEGIFGALTVEFGDRMKTRKKESGKTRLLLRLTVYCLKILVRWLYG